MRLAVEDPEWETRLARLWRDWSDCVAFDLVAAVDSLAEAREPDDGAALFERASARDSSGRTAEAVSLYGKALTAGLDPWRRRRAAIQLASSCRLLGCPETGFRVLMAAREERPEELDDALEATLALVLVDLGRAREAAGIALQALSKHLPRYNRSIRRYAGGLLDGSALERCSGGGATPVVGCVEASTSIEPRHKPDA